MTTDAVKTEREPRHIDLDNAISNDLSHAVGEVTALKDKISGSEEPPTEDLPPAIPPAAEVYSNAPGQIRDLSQRICNLVAEIQEMVL